MGLWPLNVHSILIYFDLCYRFMDTLAANSFADDIQLQMSAPPDKIYELLHSTQPCISDVKAWATANILRLNDNKTQLTLVTSKRTKHLYDLPTSITIENAEFPFKQSVKNLGFTLDCRLTINAHVSHIARTCYFELRRLASIRRFLTSTATATHVSAFVLIIIIIMVILKCYFSGEHIALSINENNNGVNIALGKTNILKALCMMQINT